MELHRAIIYTADISNEVTGSDVRDAIYMYPVN
jgi:hypothetical protein